MWELYCTNLTNLVGHCDRGVRRQLGSVPMVFEGHPGRLKSPVARSGCGYHRSVIIIDPAAASVGASFFVVDQLPRRVGRIGTVYPRSCRRSRPILHVPAVYVLTPRVRKNIHGVAGIVHNFGQPWCRFRGTAELIASGQSHLLSPTSAPSSSPPVHFFKGGLSTCERLRY